MKTPSLPNPDLLSRIPWTARTILEVGCGDGALGAAYRRVNPLARLLGIELDLSLAKEAVLHFDEVVAADVEAEPVPFGISDGLDCIVYGDVLEHLRDPWSLLRRHAEALTANGVMLICIPNVEHWSFAARLLRGNWHYEPSGLLDEGHLRWFTLDGFQNGLRRLGLFPSDVSPRIFREPEGERFIRELAPSLEALEIDQDDYARRARPLQYVWRVRRSPGERIIIASTMLQPVGGVSDVRVVYPLRALATDPLVTAFIVQRDETNLPSGCEARIMVLHRPVLSGNDGLRTIRKILDQGYLIVTEFDDHPDYFPALLSEEQFGFTGVHAIQTTTPLLAEIFKQQNSEVAVFPNAVRSLPDIRNFVDSGCVTLFFGALNREADWEPNVPVLNDLAAQFGARLRFSVVHDRRFFEKLATPHKEFSPTCDHEEYLRRLSTCEISFMPLENTAFNRAKSDLKFIEAAACRAVPLASRVVYADSVVDGQTGILFEGAEQLRAGLTQLVTLPSLARDIGDNARRYVAEKRMLAYQIAARQDWYRDLWGRRKELTDALLGRVPALAPDRVRI